MASRNRQDTEFEGIIEIIFALIRAALISTAFVLGMFLRDPLIFLGVSATAAVAGIAVGYATSAFSFFILGSSFTSIVIVSMLGVAAGTWYFLWIKCRPPAPAFNAIDECDEKNDFESKMLCLGRKLEAIFKKGFLTEGRGPNEHLDNAIEKGMRATDSDVRNIRKIATIRNRAAHEDGYKPQGITYQDLKTLACSTLDSLRYKNQQLAFLVPENKEKRWRQAMSVMSIIPIIYGCYWAATQFIQF